MQQIPLEGPKRKDVLVRPMERNKGMEGLERERGDREAAEAFVFLLYSTKRGKDTKMCHTGLEL